MSYAGFSGSRVLECLQDRMAHLVESSPCCQVAKSGKSIITGAAGRGDKARSLPSGLDAHSRLMVSEASERLRGPTGRPARAIHGAGGVGGELSSLGGSVRPCKEKGVWPTGIPTGLLRSLFCTIYSAWTGWWLVCQPRASFADAGPQEHERKQPKWMPSGDLKWSGSGGRRQRKSLSSHPGQPLTAASDSGRQTRLVASVPTGLPHSPRGENKGL